MCSFSYITHACVNEGDRQHQVTEYEKEVFTKMGNSQGDGWDKKRTESKSVTILSATNEHQEHWHLRNRTDSIQKLRTARFLLLLNHFVSYLYATSICWCRPGRLEVFRLSRYVESFLYWPIPKTRSLHRLRMLHVPQIPFWGQLAAKKPVEMKLLISEVDGVYIKVHSCNK